MTVYFIGAGPGAPDLLTIRGRDLIAAAPVCIYAGSLIPAEILQYCPKDAEVINSASMSLEEIIAKIKTAHANGQNVVRLHSGDLSIWSAMGEQLRKLRELNIPVEVCPGVPAFSAAAASLQVELTLPELVQSVVLTRSSGRATQMPSTESLENFAKTKAVLAIHLSIHVLPNIVEELTPHYGADCPVAIIWRASWPDERIVVGTLGDIESKIPEEAMRTALILVGQSIAPKEFGTSQLYAQNYDRRFRPQGTNPRFPEGTEDQ